MATVKITASGRTDRAIGEIERPDNWDGADAVAEMTVTYPDVADDVAVAAVIACLLDVGRAFGLTSSGWRRLMERAESKKPDSLVQEAIPSPREHALERSVTGWVTDRG